jgi:site-specific DNA-methyltransferase (adenine-specific)
MMPLLNGRVLLHAGDCLDVLPALPENSIDACVTDGPYELPSIARRFGNADAAKAKGRIYQGAFDGFRGNPEIVSNICTKPEVWREVLRVLKPGGQLLAFGPASVGFARMHCAIVDAGFDDRGIINWTYATGIPKGKPLDKHVDRRLLGRWCDADELARGPLSHTAAFYESRDIALKPAFEPIAWARKPLIGTVAENLIAHGTGSIGIDDCRIGAEGGYPTNMILDDSDVVAAMFPGGEAQFFYRAKADAHDRAGSDHPTVKPVDLIQYLVRLVTTPGQIILDPFAGSGTLGEAAFREGRHAVLIEINPKFQEHIARRMALALAGPEERQRESIKAKVGDVPFEAGSLFAGL